MTSSEEPFSTPKAEVLAPEELPAELPEERIYRPSSRLRHQALRWGIFLGLVILFVTVTLRGANELLMIATAWVVLVFWLLRHRLRVPGWMKRNEAAAAMIGAGEISRAAEELDALCAEGTGMPLLHALFVFNRGVAFLHQGEYSRALSLFAAVLASKWTRTTQIPNFHGLVLGEAALALALAGDSEHAQQLRSAARQHLPETSHGRLILLDAILALRTGDHRAAAGLIKQNYHQAEGQIGARGTRALRLLWAYALERSADASHQRDIQRLVDGAWPFQPGELEYLLGSWPELRAFLSRHAFTS